MTITLDRPKKQSLSIHPLELYTSLNRDFFKGTVVQKEAEDYLASVKP